MNRILAFILCISIIVAIPAVVLADTSNEIDLSDLEEATLLLEKLNVISDKQDMTSALTRADLAIFLAKLLNVDIYSISDKAYYNDIEKNFWAKTAIDNLTDRGIFTVGSDKLFRPNDKVTLNELCKVLIVIAGYDNLAKAKGGWHQGYINVANELDLLDNMNFGTEITAEQLTLLFYRTLKLNPLKATGIDGDSVVYAIDKDETVMSLYHNIYEVSGQVTGLYKIGINGETNLKENQVEIDGQVYNIGTDMVDLYTYIGLNVNCFYKKDDNSYVGEIILAIPDGDNDIIQFNKEDMKGIEDRGSVYSLTYYDENNKTKTQRIARGVAIIKNGSAVEENILDSFKIKKGYFKLIDYNGDGINDVVMIFEYYDMVVGQIVSPRGVKIISESPHSTTWGDVASEQIIYDKYDAGLSVNVLGDSDRVVKLKNSTGDYIELGDIAVGDVLSVYSSHDDKIVEVYKNTEVIRGTVEEFITDEGTSIVVNGTAYKISEECLSRSEHIVKAGFNGVFKLNMFGVVAYIEANSDSQKLFGYLLDHDYQSKGLTDAFKLKLFGVDGVMHYLDMSDKAEIDGIMVKMYSDMVQRLSNSTENFTPQIVRYGLDSEGKINFIDTAYLDPDFETDASLFVGEARNGLYIGNRIGGSGNSVISSTETNVMIVPDDDSVRNNKYEDDWFKVMKASSLSTTTTYSGTISYRYDLHADFEDVLVIKNGTGETWGSTYNKEPCIIEKVTQGISEDGDLVNKIYAYQSSSSPATLLTKDLSVLSGYNLKKGDVVWLNTDVQNRVIEVLEVLYKADAGKTFEGYQFGKPTSTPGAQFRILSCNASETSGNVVRVAYNQPESNLGDIDESFVFSSSVSIYVFDKNAGKDGMIYKGSVSDIVDYRKGGDDCSELAIYCRNGAPVKVFVYK